VLWSVATPHSRSKRSRVMPFGQEFVQKDACKRDWERASGVMATGLRTRMSHFEYTSFALKKRQHSASAPGRFFPLVRGERLLTAKSSAVSSVIFPKPVPQRVGARTIVRRRPTSRFLVDVEWLMRLDPGSRRKNREVGRFARTHWGARCAAVKPCFRAGARTRVYIPCM
jgi:hypothetical protein